MLLHLIQPQTLFGPPERQEELRLCWGRNKAVFDEFTHPEGRPTFTELFAVCKSGRINVIANSDIYFERLAHYPPPGEVWALSRYDIDPTGTPVLWNHPDSADTWVVNGTLRPMDIPWPMGIPGIDNRIAHELQTAGYTVKNPSKTVRTYHLHLSHYRSYLEGGNGQGRGGRKLQRVPPPYAMVKPTEL